jgi:hypothetical protein
MGEITLHVFYCVHTVSFTYLFIFLFIPLFINSFIYGSWMVILTDVSCWLSPFIYGWLNNRMRTQNKRLEVRAFNILNTTLNVTGFGRICVCHSCYYLDELNKITKSLRQNSLSSTWKFKWSVWCRIGKGAASGTPIFDKSVMRCIIPLHIALFVGSMLLVQRTWNKYSCYVV